MEHFHALLLTFLEMTFIFVGLGMLYSQRRAIGKAPFYMALGLLFLFSHFVSAAEIRTVLFGTIDFEVGRIVIFLPILTAYLMVYITEGTLAAQRIIIGAAVLFGLYLYLGELTRLQCNWYGFSLTSGTEAVTLDNLLGGSRNSMNLVALSHLFDFLVLPIAYTRFKNFGLGRFFCILGALLTALLLGALLSQIIALIYGLPASFFNGNFIARLIAGFWLAVMLGIYLAKIEVDIRSGGKSPLDILFAFVGSYSRSKELEANLREWTDRYRLVLENAGEMIVMLTSDGRIIDANFSAARLLGSANPGELTNRRLFPRMRVLDRPGAVPVPAGREIAGEQAPQLLAFADADSRAAAAGPDRPRRHRREQARRREGAAGRTARAFAAHRSARHARRRHRARLQQLYSCDPRTHRRHQLSAPAG